jgi:hypothetical protein
MCVLTSANSNTFISPLHAFAENDEEDEEV